MEWMDRDVDLKPCPFCGDEFPTIHMTTKKRRKITIEGRLLLTDSDSFEIACRICGCRTATWLALSRAIEAWNRRAE